MNRWMASVAGFTLALPVFGGNLVFNGGFETGNFSGWTVPPNVPMQINFAVTGTAASSHSGNRYAQLSSSSLQFMSTTLPLLTTAGQDYELRFWLRSTAGLLTRTITVRWEDQVVLHQQFGAIQALPWTEFTVPLHANFTGSFLEFGQANFPGEYHIDDISVVPVPAPGVATILLVGSAFTMRRRRR
jgi:hypothetical protein